MSSREEEMKTVSGSDASDVAEKSRKPGDNDADENAKPSKSSALSGVDSLNADDDLEVGDETLEVARKGKRKATRSDPKAPSRPERKKMPVMKKYARKSPRDVPRQETASVGAKSKPKKVKSKKKASSGAVTGGASEVEAAKPKVTLNEADVGDGAGDVRELDTSPTEPKKTTKKKTFKVVAPAPPLRSKPLGSTEAEPTSPTEPPRTQPASPAHNPPLRSKPLGSTDTAPTSTTEPPHTPTETPASNDGDVSQPSGSGAKEPPQKESGGGVQVNFETESVEKDLKKLRTNETGSPQVNTPSFQPAEVASSATPDTGGYAPTAGKATTGKDSFIMPATYVPDISEVGNVGDEALNEWENYQLIMLDEPGVEFKGHYLKLI